VIVFFSTAIRVRNERACWLVSHEPEQDCASFVHFARRFSEQLLFLCAYPSVPRASGNSIAKQSIGFLAPRRLYAEANIWHVITRLRVIGQLLKKTLVWFVREIIADETNRVSLVFSLWQQFVQLALNC
jgi:hypothetical protein